MPSRKAGNRGGGKNSQQTLVTHATSAAANAGKPTPPAAAGVAQISYLPSPSHSASSSISRVGPGPMYSTSTHGSPSYASAAATGARHGADHSSGSHTHHSNNHSLSLTSDAAHTYRPAMVGDGMAAPAAAQPQALLSYLLVDMTYLLEQLKRLKAVDRQQLFGPDGPLANDTTPLRAESFNIAELPLALSQLAAARQQQPGAAAQSIFRGFQSLLHQPHGISLFFSN